MRTPGDLARPASIAVLALLIVTPVTAAAFDPQPDPPAAKCQASKLKAAGKLALCRAKVFGAFDPQPDPPKLAKWRRSSRAPSPRRRRKAAV